MPPSPQQYVANLHNRLTRTHKPRTLYHYTSDSGLLGIIETKSIWATNVRYLNDSKEYALALDRSMLIPFVAHNLCVDNMQFKLQRIIIGPTLHSTLAKHSLEMLLNKHRVPIEQIDESEIPYRDW